MNRIQLAAASLRLEAWPMVRLAGPVVVAELGWMAMGVVDTVMVGRLGAEAIGAAGIGGIVFFTVALFGMGVLFGLDTLVSQSFGARQLQDCHRALVHGVYLSLFMTPPLVGLQWVGIPLLRAVGIHPAVLAMAEPFMKALIWSTLPLLLYGTLRRYLQGMGLVKPVMVALVTANLVNLAGNWVLIYGHLGVPPLGVVGSAWATCAARVYMALFLAVYAVARDRRLHTGLLQVSLRLDPERMRRLLALGVPAAGQMTLEIGAFAAATALAGRLVPAALAAHQVSLTVASCTFMVPLGISAAAAVRVGHAMGRRDPFAAARAGWTAVALGAGFMATAALTLLLLPLPILRLFTSDEAVIQIGAPLLFIAAVFQLFDGIQVVTTGALRGVGETRIAMISNLVGYYVLGLPLGYTLCFVEGWGIRGLWIGLSAALIAVAVVLLRVWASKVHRLEDEWRETARAEAAVR